MKHVSWLRNCAAIAFVSLLALPVRAQYTTVTTTHLGGTPGASGTIYWQPVAGCAGGIGSARVGSSGGQISGIPISGTLTNGASSVSVPDALASSPNIAYAVTAIDNNGNNVIGNGLQADSIHASVGGPYGCVQPTGTTWNFDTFIPNVFTPVLPASLFDTPTTTTGSPGSSAAVSIALQSSGQYHLAFTVPQQVRAPYSQSFSSASSVSILQVLHHFQTNALVVVCYDNESPAHQIIPSQVAIDGSYNVTVTFPNALSGYCLVNGGSGPQGATGSGGSSPTLGAAFSNGGGLLTATTSCGVALAAGPMSSFIVMGDGTTGSATVDVLTESYASWLAGTPPTSITSGHPASFSSAKGAQVTDFSLWSTSSVVYGNVYCFSLTSPASIVGLTATLTY